METVKRKHSIFLTDFIKDSVELGDLVRINNTNKYSIYDEELKAIVGDLDRPFNFRPQAIYAYHDGDIYPKDHFIDINDPSLDDIKKFPLVCESASHANQLNQATSINHAFKKVTAVNFKHDLLPQFSSDFVEKFAETHAEIKEIMIECHEGDRFEPVLRNGREVIVSKVKSQWNRNEVEDLIRLAMQSKGYTPEFEFRSFINKNL